MALDEKQRGVAYSMIAGLIISFAVIYFGSNVFIHLEKSERFSISFLLPATTLFIAIARLAKHRFFTPADIDGSAFGNNTQQAQILQALLQNTLEQIAFAIPIYLVALFSTNNSIQATAPACACLFLLGRLLFFVTYKHGAKARALGFALTFYPTVMLFVWEMWLLL